MNTITTLPANTTPADAAAHKGRTVTLNLADGAELTGVLISVNSKGWNVATADAACVSRGIARVTDVTVWDESDDDMDEDTEADYIADMIEAGEVDLTDDGSDDDAAPVAELEGMTTAELAAMFGLTAKRLRVTLRAMKLGVGRGQRYHLTDTDVERVKARLAK